MPHKHKRKRQDDADFELPPSQIARPLPVAPARGRVEKQPSSRNDASRPPSKRKVKAKSDDTPRAFKRLMVYASSKRKAQGEAGRVSRKQQENEDANIRNAQSTGEGGQKPTAPKILPGEDMQSFSARVRAEMPLSGASKSKFKGGKDPLGFKQYKTRKEFKMHKLYDQWRHEDRKIKERREEELELAAERDLDSGLLQISSGAGAAGEVAFPPSRRGKKKAREEDPWEEVRRRRGEARPKLHDVAKAPPDLK